MIHLYAVLDAGAVVPPIDGIDGRPVGAERMGAVTSVVGFVEGPPEPTRENLLRHATVVDAVAELNEAILPARFSRPFATPDALDAAVAPRSAQLRGALSIVAGCVELGLHAFRPAGAEDPSRAQPVRRAGDYLRHRLAQDTELSELASRVSTPLEGHARLTRRRHAPAGAALLSAAYLIQSTIVPDFQAEVSRLQQAHPELTLVCTGPWPPYSFADVPTESA